MKTRKRNEASALAVWLGLTLACKDEHPCDPGQEERSANACYPAAAAGSTGAAVEPDAGQLSDSGPTGGGFAVGQPCTDTVASSDCGGAAPICAPLPAGAACTQVLCLEGEPNAGVCPVDWPCLQIQGYPSTCLRL